MKKNILEDLTLRESLFNFSNGTKEHLGSARKIYAGFDFTADSLQIGNLAILVLLKRLEKSGHHPYALLGSATSLIGDPSFKKDERILISKEEILNRKEKISNQIKKILSIERNSKIKIVDNSDWFSSMSLIDFLRDVGKYITVNYMQAKDSVKSRMESGISYAEFTYQLFQAYDFYFLNKNYDITVQVGGADQWGNLTSGIELARKKDQKELFAFTIPLIKKKDGSKFGKSEQGEAIWLDQNMTSVYKFYQFWINCSDTEALSYIKIFTFLDMEEINLIENIHKLNPEKRILQKELAKQVTSFVHGVDQTKICSQITEILFDREKKMENYSNELIENLSKEIPTLEISKEVLDEKIENIIFQKELFDSKSELKRLLKEKGIYINKRNDIDFENEKMKNLLISDHFIFLQKGKKNFYLLKFI
jgi:tyrosyl-tRNA synthetase